MAVELLKAAEMALEYVVIPVAAWVWISLNRVSGSINAQAVEIAVLKAQLQAERDANQRARAEWAQTVAAIFAKLDSIEAALRK